MRKHGFKGKENESRVFSSERVNDGKKQVRPKGTPTRLLTRKNFLTWKKSKSGTVPQNGNGEGGRRLMSDL